MSDFFDRILLPVASVEDAKTTARAVEGYVRDDTSVLAVHVIEKAGGAPDKASVEQREEYASDIFAAVSEILGQVDTDLRFSTAVDEAIFEAASDHDATAIVFTPRGGSRWLRLLTGDVALDIVTKTDRPVVVLPDPDIDDGSDPPTEGTEADP